MRTNRIHTVTEGLLNCQSDYRKTIKVFRRKGRCIAIFLNI